MNIVYIGSSGYLSVLPLRFLLLSGHRPTAVAIDANTSTSLQNLKTPIIAGSNESVEMLAAMNRVPVIQLFDAETDYIAEIKSYKPDVILVSCFEKKLPDELLNLPKLGCFNFHPSLLPAFRGPVPLFWQFRQGVENFGMSLHRMSSHIDAGPVVAQLPASMPDGVSNEEANEILAGLAVDMLAPLLDRLERGEEVAETLQNETEATSMSYPQQADFEVYTCWTARRIYNFMCATQHWGQTYRCEVAGHHYELIRALSYQNSETGEGRPVIHGQTIAIPCERGTLLASFISD